MSSDLLPFPKNVSNATRGFFGYLTVFLSAFCFYFSTVVIRWSRDVVTIDAAYFVFARFLLGFLTVCAAMAIKRQGPVAKRYDLLIGRTVGNCIAVFCFFQAVHYTSVAEANILNMTYPMFIAIMSWLFLRDQRDPVALIMAGVALGGVWLILRPDRMGLCVYSLWGLSSGISGAVAIFCLNLSRRYHDSNTVLFYMFGLGTILIYILFHAKIFWPNPTVLYYLALCGGTGVVGQFLLTLGFRYVTAVEGGVISSSRILLAAVLGPFLAAEPLLSLVGWVGAAMIFGANVVLAIRKGH